MVKLRRFAPRWPLILAVSFCVYALVLLWNVFAAQDLLRSAADSRLVADSHRRALAISEFTLDRRNSAEELAHSHEIEAYLVNRALGMSLQYGLNANLEGIEQLFRRHLNQKTLRGAPVYQRILFADAQGEILVDLQPDAPPINLPDGPAHEVRLHIDAQSRCIIVLAPVWHKDEYQGVVVTVGDLDQLALLLISSGNTNETPAQYQELLVGPDGLVIMPPGTPYGIDAPSARLLTELPQGHLLPIRTLPGHPHALSDWLAVRSAVAGTPLSLLTLMTEESVYGHLSSRVFLYSLGLFPLILLFATIAFDRMRLKAIRFQAKYAEADRLRHQSEDQNRRLSQEIARREALERDLRENTKRLEDMAASLKASATRAKEASRAKSDFLAAMSHEIRTPMNGILGLTDLVLKSELSQRQRSYLEMVHSSADRLLKLINDILDFSKIEAGRLELDIAPFSLRETVSQTLEILAISAAKKNVDLVVDCARQIPDQLLGDADKLSRVLINLVGNGIKFTDQGSVTVTVSDRRPPAPLTSLVDLHFEIKDTGIGIPENQINNVFNTFSQLSTTRDSNNRGTGLGLVIAAELVEMMDGKISVESVPGTGTTFRFNVCLRQAPQEGTVEPSPPCQTSRRIDPETLSGSLHILLVEDEYINQTLAVSLLEREGWQVTVAGDGQEALEKHQPGQFDLILMDIQMPNMDGYAATQAIRSKEAERGCHTPIIAMTAYAIKGDREKCLAAGMDGYISKPVNPEQVRREIESVLIAVHRLSEGSGKPG